LIQHLSSAAPVRGSIEFSAGLWRVEMGGWTIPPMFILSKQIFPTMVLEGEEKV
jgi:hypothetical protein